MWVDICKEDNLPGFTLYNQFEDVMILTENNRLDQSNSDAIIFDELLDSLRNGKNTEQDWNILCKKCSYYSIGAAS